MIAIKNWFLEKQGYSSSAIEDFINGTRKLVVLKETAKAVLVKYYVKSTPIPCEMWVPKSCLIDEWEKQTSPFAYHDYLLKIAHDAYNQNKLFEKHTIKSGRNVYSGDAFFHQYKSKTLKEMLEKYNIEYMTYAEFKNR